jgi:hypothetical protein
VGSILDTRSAEAWAIAKKQHGVITRRQLLALGFSRRSIEHRLSRGRLHSVARGVYVVGWHEMTQTQRWMVAVLACGEGAALSHRSAAALWGIGNERPGVVDVSVRRRCRLRRPDLKIRARRTLALKDIGSRDGIPVTGPVRTLVDLGTELNSLVLERTVNEADKRNLVDPETLRTALDGYAGEPGVRPLRKLLDKRTFRLSDSALEVLFRPIAAAADLPPPLTKQMVNGFEVDFYWPNLDLVVETDGLRYHRTPSAQARDAQRDRAHALAGMTSLRFTHYEVKFEAAQVRAELRRIAAALRERASDIDHT